MSGYKQDYYVDVPFPLGLLVFAFVLWICASFLANQPLQIILGFIFSTIIISLKIRKILELIRERSIENFLMSINWEKMNYSPQFPFYILVGVLLQDALVKATFPIIMENIFVGTTVSTITVLITLMILASFAPQIFNLKQGRPPKKYY